MMNKKEYYENCEKCGRPWKSAPRIPCECSCKYGTGEYCGKRPGCIRKKNPECPYNAVIASVTVDTVDGLDKLRDCLVHVTSNNTTYYVDDKGRIMITWAGPVNIPGYDMDTNPNNYRDQIVTDVEAKTAVIYDKNGRGYIFGLADNLDIQEEVNNKLDEMAQDGTLANIIAQYIGLGALVTFDTLTELISSHNLADGTKCKTLGKESKGDGFGAYYTIGTTGDIQLDNGLFATLVPNFGGNNYYDEITFTENRANDTDYYITTVPKDDNDGNTIKLYLAQHPGISPNQYARQNYTTLTMNAPIAIDNTIRFGSMIINGEIVADVDTSGINEAYTYIGIKDNGLMVGYTAKDTTANEMLSDGCVQAFMAYNKLIENDQIVDFSQIHVAESQHIIDGVHPRQAIGQKEDGTVIVFTCDGRTPVDTGMTCQQMADIMHSLGCVNAWNLDGGGSSSTSIKGTKINKNIDGNGSVDRIVSVTLNVKKEIIDEELAKTYSQIGNVKQQVMTDIMPEVRFNTNRVTKTKLIAGSDLNNITELTFGMGSNLTNTPTNQQYGYLINIPHASSEWVGKYDKQIFFERDNSRIFTRQQVNGVWTNWELVGQSNLSAFGEDFTATSNTYQALSFDTTNFRTNIDGLFTLTDAVDPSTIGKRIAINKYGSAEITAIVTVTPASDGEKMIAIYAGDYENRFSIANAYGKTGQPMQLVSKVIIPSFTPNNNFNVRFKGANGDTVTNIKFIISR